MGLRTDRFISDTISMIYDCAVDPELWTSTLDQIREGLDLAYVGLSVVEFRAAAPPRPFLIRGTKWDTVWLDQLMGSLESLPGFHQMRHGPIDQPIVFRRLIPKKAFEESAFFRDWVAPQGLHDACNTPVIQRVDLTAMLTAWTAKGSHTLSSQDLDTLTRLAPHLRRAILISELLDRERKMQRVHAALLDQLTVALLLVDADGSIVYANSPAERALHKGHHLRSVARRVRPANAACMPAFMKALHCATMARDEMMDSWGCGIVLPAADGSAAAAYFLPFGQSEKRQALGEGIAAVALVGSDAAPPPPVELMAALFGLTSTEARVALAVAEGHDTMTIIKGLGIKPNTLKTHLAAIFSKTGASDRAALGANINRLRLPLNANHDSLAGR